MAEIIEYPDMNNANPDEWRVLIQDLELFTGGFLLLDVQGLDTAGAPVIKAGSRLDINGSRYKCPADETIGGTLVNNKVNYVYAAANGNSAGFLYRDAGPVWNAAKGGWYQGNDRAVLRLFYSSTGPLYGNKMILDSAASKHEVNQKYRENLNTSAAAGQLYQAAVNQVLIVSLSPGLYVYQIKAGRGGNGGANAGGSGGAGGAGADGEALTGVFELFSTTSIKLACGGNGSNGVDGGASSGGGGGASGGTSFIISQDNTTVAALATGGSGGGGKGRRLGGGGAGAYGWASAGGTDDEGVPGGQGGHAGIGGNGGIFNVNTSTEMYGGGGSGYVAGGEGGSPQISIGRYDYPGVGGGYGKPGGVSIDADNGGASRKIEVTPVFSLPSGSNRSSALYPFVYNNCQISWQGGGAGNGGSGGGGLQGASNGYARIYRVG
jgi:hypothetical protein